MKRLTALIESLKFSWFIFVILMRDVAVWLFSKKKKAITEDVVLITGGGRGIGRSLALKLAVYHPKHIVLCGRTESSLMQTVKEIRELKVNCSYMVCDVSSREEIYAMAREVQAKCGDVTILVNNAGVVFPCSILEGQPGRTELTLQTNTLAHFWTVRAFLPNMLQHKKGHIVSVTSVLGFSGLNGASDYCVTKFAASGFSEALRDELRGTEAGSSIQVTAVYPYMVDNSMFAGVSTRFPRLFPAIDEEYLGEKIAEAILTDRAKVIVPRIMYLVAIFYSIAPVAAITPIMKFVGVHKSMEAYHAHRARSQSVQS